MFKPLVKMWLNWPNVKVGKYMYNIHIICFSSNRELNNPYTARTLTLLKTVASEIILNLVNVSDLSHYKIVLI